MKNHTLITALLLLLNIGVFAQAPTTMNYQAVVRDENNFVKINTEIGMRISILYGSVDGEAVYVETQRPTTNEYGMITVEIGAGKIVSGAWMIDWQKGDYYLKTEYDISFGNSEINPNYTISATSKILAVPIALFSQTSASLTGPVWDLVSSYKGTVKLNAEGGIYNLTAYAYIHYTNTTSIVLDLSYDYPELNDALTYGDENSFVQLHGKLTDNDPETPGKEIVFEDRVFNDGGYVSYIKVNGSVKDDNLKINYIFRYYSGDDDRYYTISLEFDLYKE